MSKYTVIHVTHPSFGGEIVPLIIKSKNLGKALMLSDKELKKNKKYFGHIYNGGSVKPREEAHFATALDAINKVIGIIRSVQTGGVPIGEGILSEPTSMSVMPNEGQKLLVYPLKV